MSEQDRSVLSNMQRYGGSFVQALACAAWRADADNLARIKSTWPEYWEKYKSHESMVRGSVAAAILETHPMTEYQKDE